MTLGLDRNLQAPASVRDAVRKLARAHQPDERVLVWQRRLKEYTQQTPTPGDTAKK